MIFRSGYYGGTGGRLVQTLAGIPGGRQPECQHTADTGLINCSNWRVSASLTIPTEWVSGVYLAKLIRHDTGGENYFPFIVRDDVGHSDILYQLSFSTYQAYNGYGGKSLYSWNSDDCDTVAQAPRAVAVSFDRPYFQPELYYSNSYLWADYPMVYWLESQGYDVSYSTNVDTHRSGLEGAANQLLNHRLFLSVGHDEYWSQPMRDAITAARDSGVHLAIFSANTGYWRVRLEPDPLSGRPDRVMIGYKTSESGEADPSGHHTALWRDPATVNQPENQLLGVQYIGENDAVFFPIRVSAEMARDRIYRHTGLESLPPDSYVNIGHRLVGWEWDTVTDNGFTPAGITILAASPAHGMLRADPADYNNTSLMPATVHTTRYIADSGAIVFAAGTNLWSWGLAIAEPEPLLQQITYNILADMGALPATMSDYLIPDSAPSEATLKSRLPAAEFPAIILADPADSPPDISNLEILPDAEQVTIRWQTDQPATGEIWLGEASDRINEVEAYNESYGQAHEFTITDLAPQTNYYLQVIAATESQQVTVSPVQPFQTGLGSLWARLKGQFGPVYRSSRCWFQVNPLLSIGLIGGVLTGSVWVVGRLAVRLFKFRGRKKKDLARSTSDETGQDRAGSDDLN